MFVVLRARGTYADRVSFAESRRVDVSTFFLASRALSAIAGTATIYVVYAIGRQLWNPPSGWCLRCTWPCVCCTSVIRTSARPTSR